VDILTEVAFVRGKTIPRHNDKPTLDSVFNRSPWFAEAMTLLLERREVPRELMAAAFRQLTAGGADEAEAAAFLVALRMKGETAAEIAAAAEVLREQMVCLPPSGRAVLDTCGTGGDESGTFNISTAAALVVAGCGVPVVKHGNRSASSRSGSADVLVELGVPIELGPEWAARCLQDVGLAFCFAPHFHPAMARAAALRRKLGVRTLFNLLGPLLNPARAEYQLLGVGRIELLDPLAGALARLGVGQAFVVCSQDGLDEVSLGAPTSVRHVGGQQVIPLEWTAADFGLEPAPFEELRVEGVRESAEVLRALLAGQDGSPRRVVLANAAAALLAAEEVSSLKDGVSRAAAAIDTGKAKAVLERLQRSG
jgi:anthranilate phosphoribosyltransferase